MSGPFSFPDLLSGLGSFALVLMLLWGTLMLLKRGVKRPPGADSHSKVRLVDSFSIGYRQRLLLLQVGEREVLIAVSPNQVNRIDAWATPDRPMDEGERNRETTSGRRPYLARFRMHADSNAGRSAGK